MEKQTRFCLVQSDLAMFNHGPSGAEDCLMKPNARSVLSALGRIKDLEVKAMGRGWRSFWKLRMGRVSMGEVSKRPAVL